MTAPDTSCKRSLYFDPDTDFSRYEFYEKLPLGTQMNGATLKDRAYIARPGNPRTGEVATLLLEVVFEYPDKRFEPV